MIDYAITKKTDGYLIRHPNGRCAFMTVTQCILYKLFKIVPPLDYRTINGFTQKS